MSNVEVARLLRNVAASYTIKDENKFRFQIIAYTRAADSVEHATSEIRDLWQDGKLDTLAGIGSSIKSHLEELFKTGKVRHFDWAMKGVPPAVFPLLEVPNFGPKKAYKLVIELKLKDPKTVLDSLEKLAKQGKIANLAGFGEKSEQDIIQAIAEYRQGLAKTTRMVLPYAYELASKVVSYLKEFPQVKQVYPLGSLRRMVATVGDIDIAVASSDPNGVIKYFVNYPAVSRVIEKGERTASVIVSGGVQIDLMVQPEKAFGALLQHFTGSKHHNIHLREYALKKGLSLSEYGIKDHKGKLVRFATEEAFYEALGLKFIPPELREDQGEIEAVLPNLVDLKDIRGDLHIHSNYPIEPSHDLGINSMEEMVRKAKSLKYEYIGFSEHNPSINKHDKNSINRILTKRKKFIEQIKLKIKDVHIVNLLEVDILTDGQLAISDEASELIDGAIVSIHSSFDQSKAKMTKRVLAGLSHPKTKILAHPTGRLLRQREGYELDWDKVFDFCKSKNKALEINAYPTRLDLPDVLVREAVKKGVKMVINTDSHQLYQMELMRYGVAVARRGWAEKGDILNALPFKEFIQWLKS